MEVAKPAAEDAVGKKEKKY